LKTEVESAGGEASVFAAGSVDTWSDDALVDVPAFAARLCRAGLEIDVILKRVIAPIGPPTGRTLAKSSLIESLR
jgi:hypothetical protein